MPLDVKKAIASLILSFFARLLADYVDSIYIEGYEFFDSLILGLHLLWLTVLAWIIYDILKKKDIDFSLFAVSAILISITVAEYMEFGFMLSHIFTVLEIVFILLSVYFLKSGNSKLWASEKKQ